MRKYCMLLAFVAINASAQDVIVKKDGSTILSKVLEVSSTDIKYKKFSNPDGPTYTINTTELLSINYANGEKDDFSKVESKPVSPSESKTDVQFSEEDKKVNKEVLNNCIARIPSSSLKANKSKAVLLYTLFKPTSESVMADANVELSFKTDLENVGMKGGGDLSNGGFFIATVRNKSNKTIYLDLANTFFVRGSQSAPYYIPTATSNTQGTSSSVGVNVGKITGVGGALNGLNVGSGSSNYNTTITYSQRVIAVPPMSSRDLPGMCYFPDESAPKYYGSGINMMSRGRYGTSIKYPHFANSISLPATIGSMNDYQEGDVPLKFSLFFSYSFTEDVAIIRSLNTNFNVRRIIGIPEARMMGIAMPIPKKGAINSAMSDEAYIIMYQDN